MDRLNNFPELLGFIQKHKSIIRDFHKKWRCKQGCQSRWFWVTSAVSEDVAGKYVEMFVQQGRTVNITHGIVTSWCTWEQISLFFITCRLHIIMKEELVGNKRVRPVNILL